MKIKDRITLEIGGSLFTTTKRTLSRIPNTRLSNLDENDVSYDPNTGHYFFDRNPELFNWVLDAYRRGTVHFPHQMCPSFVVEELSYWQITECKLAKCCWFWLKTHEMEYGIRDRIEKTFTQHMYLQERWREGCLKDRIYLMLQEPTSSTAAKVWGILFLIVMTLSIASQVLLTIPEFRTPVTLYRNMSTITNPKMALFLATEPHAVIRTIEYISTIIFLLDILIRFAICPDRLAFFKCPYNLIDLLATLPTAFIIIMVNVKKDYTNDHTLFYTVVVMAGLGVFRVLRLFKFMRQYDGVTVLFLALKASTREICLLLLLIAVGTLIFSTLIYFSEFGQEDDFDNIPIGFWWSIVTMTTVGYGDMFPKSAWGYVVGSMCAVCGMVFTGLPIPIIASNFNLYYTYAKTKKIMVENTLREIKKKRQNGLSFCEFSASKGSSSTAKISPSPSIQSIDLSLVTQGRTKENNVYSDVIRELSDINETDELKTDNVWTHIKRVASVDEFNLSNK